MPVPSFQKLFLPFLTSVADGKVRSRQEAGQLIAQHFQLSEADLEERTPGGTQRRFDNRVAWAKTYLTNAHLLEATGRNRFRITERGLALLATKPESVDNNTLAQYPEFREFRERNGADHAPARPLAPAVEGASDAETPEERLELAYQDLRVQLGDTLIRQVMSCSPAFFEKLVVDLLLEMGYGGSRRDAGQAVGQTSDGGIDGIINEDRLGLDVIYIQAKRWEGAVGSPVVRDFVGSLVGHSANKGVLITTSRFSKEAEEFAKRIPQKVVLIDGSRLSALMMDFGIGVAPIAKYEVQRLDVDYFEPE